MQFQQKVVWKFLNFETEYGNNRHAVDINSHSFTHLISFEKLVG